MTASTTSAALATPATPATPGAPAIASAVTPAAATFPTLAAIQSCYFAAMRAPAGDTVESAALLAMLEGPPRVKSRRLAAYRRNYYGNLVNALEISFPVIRQIVGEAFFREAARHYIVERPGHSGDLNDYGQDFGDFLAAYPHAAELPYLCDTARLEWAVQAVSLGADTPAASLLDDLAAVPAERYGELVFSLEANIARIDSRWPIATIWQVNQPGYAGEMAVDFSRSESVLVRRGELELIDTVFVITLTPAEAAFFDRMRDGESLMIAVERALAVDGQFDYGAVLQAWIADGRLRSARLAPSSRVTPTRPISPIAL